MTLVFIAMNKEEAKELFGFTDEILQSSNLYPDRVDLGVDEFDLTKGGIPFVGDINSMQCTLIMIFVQDKCIYKSYDHTEKTWSKGKKLSH